MYSTWYLAIVNYVELKKINFPLSPICTDQSAFCQNCMIASHWVPIVQSISWAKALSILSTKKKENYCAQYQNNKVKEDFKAEKALKVEMFLHNLMKYIVSREGGWHKASPCVYVGHVNRQVSVRAFCVRLSKQSVCTSTGAHVCSCLIECI